ncbi:SDR family oxidoreductase [Mycolicibacterium sp. A43C]
MNDNITVLITGANRGLGRRIAEEFLARGAKVYAGARRPETVHIAGAIPVRIDITDPESVRQAAETASDVTVLVNNAGISTRANLLSGSVDDIRAEMETHYFGTLNVMREFAPIIENNGGGKILNVLSVLSLAHPATSGAYAAAKAAAWALTDAMRDELGPRGVTVTALHVGYMDTDMVNYIPAEQKSDPAAIARQAVDGVLAGANEVLADDTARRAKAALSRVR